MITGLTMDDYPLTLTAVFGLRPRARRASHDGRARFHRRPDHTCTHTAQAGSSCAADRTSRRTSSKKPPTKAPANCRSRAGRHPDGRRRCAGLAPTAKPAVHYFRMSGSAKPPSAVLTSGTNPPPPPVAGTASPPAAVSSSAVPAATQAITTVAVANGQPANGYREVLNIKSVSELSGCDRPSPAVVSTNICDCYPSAAAADLCWPSPPSPMLCLNDPWDKELRRFSFDTGLLPTVQPVSAPARFALFLDDGTRCRLISGGARGGRPDGYLPAYTCGLPGSTLAVLMGPHQTDAIDRSQPLWTVHVADLGSALLRPADMRRCVTRRNVAGPPHPLTFV